MTGSPFVPPGEPKEDSLSKPPIATNPSMIRFVVLFYGDSDVTRWTLVPLEGGRDLVGVAGCLHFPAGAGGRSSSPYTSTPPRVPTYTRPLATVGIVKRSAVPARSRCGFCSL